MPGMSSTSNIRPSRLRGLLAACTSCALLCVTLLVAIGPARPADASASVAATTTPAPRPSSPRWPDDGATDHPIASTGCKLPPTATPGKTSEESLAVNPATNQGFTTRSYWIHLPPGYEASRPTPLVLVFHGGGGTSAGAESSTGISRLADQKGFIAVYPQGLPFSQLGGNYTTWAATGPLDSISGGTDDLLFVSVLLDALQARYCVDPRRIYATGFSAGGAMTAFLTCGLTGRIAAFAPFSGDAYQFLGGCFPRHPTSIIEFHGGADPHELYVGIPAREDPDWRRMGVMEWLTTWGDRDHCTGSPRAFMNDAAVLAEQWAGCPPGIELVHYRIAGLGHTLPPPIAGKSAIAIMWDFFAAHPLAA